MYDYTEQPWKTAGEDARGAAAPVRRLRDRPGLRRRRGQRRDVGLVPVRRRGPLPAAGGQPELRHRLAAVQEGDDPPARARHRGQARRTTARATSTCRGCGSTAGAGTRRYLPHSMLAGGADARRSTWARGRRGWATARRHGAAVADEGRRAGAAAARRHRQARRRARRRAPATTWRRCSTTRRPPTAATGNVGRVRVRPAARRSLLHADVGRAAAATRSAWTLKGSNDGGRSWTVLDTRSGETFRWRSQTRAFKVARPGRYARYRLEVTAAARSPRSSCSTTTRPCRSAPRSAASAAWAGSTVPVQRGRCGTTRRGVARAATCRWRPRRLDASSPASARSGRSRPARRRR